jgi:hypothetical protein
MNTIATRHITQTYLLSCVDILEGRTWEERLDLELEGPRLNGVSDGLVLSGAVKGSQVEFKLAGPHGVESFRGLRVGSIIWGSTDRGNVVRLAPTRARSGNRSTSSLAVA